MKNYGLISLILSIFFIIGCEGDFEKSTFAINLLYPEPGSNCEEGEANGDKITIPFRWMPQGDIQTYELVLNKDSIVVDPIKKGDSLEFSFPVEYGTAYNWKIRSAEAESELQFFQTPSKQPNNQNVPLAVTLLKDDVIITSQNESTTVSVSWTTSDQGNNPNLRYDFYWSRDSNVSPENNEGKMENETLTSVSFNIPGFSPDQFYYFQVVAKDSNNSSSSTLKYCQTCD